jgi:protein import protein ZIM17
MRLNRGFGTDYFRQIFSDTSITIEDIMREKGEFIKKGSLGADGDVEFYDDQAGTEEQQEQKKLS